MGSGSSGFPALIQSGGTGAFVVVHLFTRHQKLTECYLLCSSVTLPDVRLSCGTECRLSLPLITLLVLCRQLLTVVSYTSS